ncbi:tyrosine-type recombinase/integrase [Pseudomonas sp. p50]|uniref:tyrosine-type recombinase/integrase n=1 Tax=Pseudomonas sp. p50(2008) TaxID=2816832 RepID=UPI00188C2BFD|nr:tyrosine-type recombinase/integrase [Pseudomonas sp. p50(2008)]MBF4559220.1 tyrosine-type recombinase/integrase [Pseudomonas sp. p50(2008)]
MNQGSPNGDDDDDDDDDIQHVLDEALDIDFSDDLEDAGELELERLLLESTGTAIQTESTLLKKLALYPNGNFPISKYSLYSDPSWIIFKNEDGSVMRINFDSLSEPMTAIKKSIMYHLIPEFAPFAGIRAYSTSRGHSQKYSIITKYVFIDNHLTGDAESLSFITAKLLNNALDRAKDSVAFTHYHYLFMQIRLWISLSTQQLIPVEHRISVSATAIDTPERKKDVIGHFNGSVASWVPFKESDLKKMFEYASFWTEKAMAPLQKVAEFAQDQGYLNVKSKTLARYQTDVKLEKNLNLTIDETRIVEVKKTRREYESGFFWNYSWYSSAIKSLDSIRCAIYILVALVTGLRVSEIDILEFKHVILGKDGRYKLQVTRYKTSKDPNYKGDTTFIPIPKFVGKKIKEYEQLRKSLKTYREGYLFQSVVSTKKVNKRTSLRIEYITQKIEEELGIDRVHTHRFRKTIAEILINRNERNVDIIRLLFGHASYAMTLRYIGRNPYIVQSVAQAIEKNYIEEFMDIVSSVKNSSSSGEGAQRMLNKIAARPEAFSGKQLKVTIFTYVTHLLSSGEPLFIYRTAVGSYCVTTGLYSSPSLPPCLIHHKGIVKDALPDPLFCDPSCTHAVIVEKAQKALQDNVDFYQHMLTEAEANLSETSKAMLRQKIIDNSKHLERLKTNRSYQVIPTVDVQA